MIDPRKLAKQIVGVIVQIGCGTIIHGAIKANVEPKNLASKAGVFVASAALVAVVSDTAVAKSDEVVDKFFDEYEKFMKKVKQ